MSEGVSKLLCPREGVKDVVLKMYMILSLLQVEWKKIRFVGHVCNEFLVC